VTPELTSRLTPSSTFRAEVSTESASFSSFAAGRKLVPGREVEENVFEGLDVRGHFLNLLFIALQRKGSKRRVSFRTGTDEEEPRGRISVRFNASRQAEISWWKYRPPSIAV
jgi:hypothetical protein